MLSQLFKNIKSDILNKGYTSRLVFKKPNEKAIVVFDSQLLWLLKRILLDDLDYGVIHVRGEEFYLIPSLVLKTIYVSFSRKTSFSNAYFSELTKLFSPRVLVTIIDNNLNFSNLKELNPIPSYYAIQNGFRLDSEIQKINHIENFFCFGHREVDLYKSSKVNVQNFIPLGSLKYSYFKEKVIKNSPKKFDICLISQYRNGMIDSDSKIWQVIKLMHEYLNKFILETGLSLAIALTPKGSNDIEEKNYFTSLFADKAKLVSNDKRFSSYSLGHNSHVLVSFHSTLAFEFFGDGKKTLFCAGLGGNKFLKKYNFNENKSDLMLITSSDYNHFKEKLNNLLNISNRQFYNLTKYDQNYVMNGSITDPLETIKNTIKGNLI